MGFWQSFSDAAGEVAGKAVKSVQDKHAHIMELKERYESYDDERLIREFKNSSGDRKTACMLLLKERGYGKD